MLSTIGSGQVDELKRQLSESVSLIEELHQEHDVLEAENESIAAELQVASRSAV